MGITEPVLYGLNLPKKYPLISAMIGGGLGGLYAGVTHTHRFATGSSGIPAVLLYIGDDTMSFFLEYHHFAFDCGSIYGSHYIYSFVKI